MDIDRVVIAVVGPLSGPAAALGQEMANGVQLAFSDGAVEAAGITLERYDDEGAIETGVAIARELADRPEVLAVIGHYNSDVTLEAGSVYSRAGLMLVSPIVSNPALTQRLGHGVFRFTNRDDRTASAIVKHLRGELGKLHALVIETRTTYGSSMSTQFAREFERAGGYVDMYLSVAEGTTELDLLLDEIPADIDVVFYGGTFEGAALLRCLRSKGITALFATGDGCWDLQNFLRPAGPLAETGEGVLVLSATPETGKVNGSTALARRYEAEYGPINNYAINSYESARAALAAVKTLLSDGDPPSRSKMIDSMTRVRVAGAAYERPTEWDPCGDNRAAVTALHVIRDGRFHQVASYPGYGQRRHVT